MRTPLLPFPPNSFALDSFSAQNKLHNMSTETQKLVEICEQLPEAQRVEVADFAQFLLSRDRERVNARETLESWLVNAVGAANTGMTTDQIMALTRGEP